MKRERILGYVTEEGVGVDRYAGPLSGRRRAMLRAATERLKEALKAERALLVEEGVLTAGELEAVTRAARKGARRLPGWIGTAVVAATLLYSFVSHAKKEGVKGGLVETGNELVGGLAWTSSTSEASEWAEFQHERHRERVMLELTTETWRIEAKQWLRSEEADTRKQLHLAAGAGAH